MMNRRGMNPEAMARISDRLSALEDLYFPRAIQPAAIDPSQRKPILFDLLSRDAAVFLERYGSRLTFEELGEFEALEDDYEIGWHLKHLKSLMSPTSEELRSRYATVKNRRRAYMNKLISDGQYFLEDSMREREPYLHHEYVGKFQDPSGRRMARPGERWSETLMRRSEEAILVAKIRKEQQRLGVAERDWVGNEINQEVVEEEEEKEGARAGGHSHATEDPNAMNDEESGVEKASMSFTEMQDQLNQCTHEESMVEEKTNLSFAEIQDQLDQFTRIMQQKFLSGEDGQHVDYTKIDNNETLDDHWSREAGQDAEEKYFAQD